MRKARVLSLDGGGMRGIIPATVLQYVEERLIEKTKNPNTRLADYFDLIVGTSTGGLLACFFLTPNPNNGENLPSTKYTAAEALEFYTEEGYSIFNNSKRKGYSVSRFWNAAKYSPSHLEKLLLQQFGDLKMRDLIKPCVVTTYDMESKSAFFFDSREAAEKKREFYLRDVMRSTSAAPTYFPPACIENLKTNHFMTNIDGGVFANNPAMCAYAESRTTVFENGPANPSASEMLLLSIGTGGGQFELPQLDTGANWGLLKWASAVPEIMMDGSLDTVNYQMEQMFQTLDGENKLNYKRIIVPDKVKKTYSSDMADASKQNIENLKKAGQTALADAQKPNDKAHTLDKFIDLLIENSPSRELLA